MEELLNELAKINGHNDTNIYYKYYAIINNDLTEKELLSVFDKVAANELLIILGKVKNRLSSEAYIKLSDILLKKESISTYHMDSLIELSPENVKDDVCVNFMNYITAPDTNIYNVEFTIVKMLEKIKKQNITFDIICNAIEKMDPSGGYWFTEVMKLLPEELQNSDIYSKMLERAKTVIIEGEYNTKECYKRVYDNIPNNKKTAEIIMDAIDIVQFDKLKLDIINYSDELEKKNLYPKLMQDIIENDGIIEYKSLLNIIPKKYKTEENIIKMFKRIKDKSIRENKEMDYEINRLFQQLKYEDIKFSYEFYKVLIENGIEGYGVDIFKSMPQEYKTEELIQLEIKNHISNPRKIGLLMECINFDKKTCMQRYTEIINILKDNNIDLLTRTKVIGQLLKFPNYEISIEEREKIRKELAVELVNLVKKDNTQYGKEIFTPKNVKDVFNSILGGDTITNSFIQFISKFDENRDDVKQLMDKVQIIEYFSYVFKKEKENILNKKRIDEQIKEYEKEIYNKTDFEEQRNLFWSLGALYRIIPQEIQYHYKEDIEKFIDENLDLIRNEKNHNVTNFLKEMYKNNDELFLTIDNRFLESDKYIDLLGKEKYEIIAGYPEIQNIICKADDNFLKLFCEYLNYAQNELKSKDSEKGDWVPVANSIVKAYKKLDFKDINEEIKKSKFEELPQDIKRKYLHIISKDQNWFEINSIEDIINYEKIRNQICSKILDNPENGYKIPYRIRCMTRKEKIIFARLQLQFGMDIEEAKNLVNKYGKGLNDEQKHEGIGILLTKLNEILNTDENNLDNLKNIDSTYYSSTDFTELLNLESKCRESYMRQYQKSVYKPKEEDLINIQAEYEGKNLKVFKPNDNFNIVLHALGAYSDKSKRENYKTDWNMPKVANHGLCTSFVSNDNLGTARIVNVVYGFDNFSPEQLLLSSPWDIVSRNANAMFSPSSVKYNYENGIKFMAPKEQIDNTRHTHNEMVFERRHFKKGKVAIKMQPSYIVYMPEYLENKSQEEIETILQNKEDYLKQYIENDPKWEETKRAASEFDIPIVIIDRAEIAERESKKIEDKFKLFKDTKDCSLILDIINEFENNRAGNRDYHKEICNYFFSEEKLNNYIGEIEKVIEQMPTANKRKIGLQMLKKAFDSEVEKRLAFKKTGDDKIANYWKEKSFETLKRGKKNEKTKSIEIEEILDDMEEIPQSIISQIDRNIINEIKDMKDRKLYEGKKIHSDRHIQNVMLFASILGKKNNLTEAEQILLVEAAKFHDSGRTSDNDRNHAESGAKIAGDLLKKQYSSEDLKIIQVAIEYHEAKEEQVGQIDSKILNNLFEKYQLEKEYQAKAIKISELLKDADALDRTRFAVRGKLDEKYLHSQYAKELKDFATSINEKYAEKDLEIICKNNECLRESIENYRREHEGNNLYTVWAIRHHKFIPTKSKDDTIQELKKIDSEVDEQERIKIENNMVKMQEKDNEMKLLENQII